MITELSTRCVLAQGEALLTMRSLVRDKGVNLTLTDPPYGAHVHQKLGKERRNDGTAARDELTFPPLTREFVGELAAEFVRVTDGWILIFTDDRTIGWWGEALEAAGGRWVRTGQWVKTNPMPQMTGDRPGSGAEYIVIGHSLRHGGGRMQWAGGGRSAVWRGGRDRMKLHEAQKPAWLMQELAGLFAPQGSTVLDPFAGSGSTGVGVLSTERLGGQTTLETTCKGCASAVCAARVAPMPVGLSFLGIEGDPATYDSAVARLKEIA